MAIDAALIKIALIFFPGLIWASIDARWITREKDNTLFVIKSFVYGTISYVALFGITHLLLGHKLFGGVSAISIAFAESIPPQAVLYATFLAIILSVAHIYIETYKVIARGLHFLNATTKFGDEDVWDYVFQSQDAAAEYIHFRDFENQYVYSGWVMMFSARSGLRELVLEDVEVHNFDGEFLYRSPRIYISRDNSPMFIEFPHQA